MTIDEAVESMRLSVGDPNESQVMQVMADVWREAGKDPEGEALQLLGECGKVGDDYLGYAAATYSEGANPNATAANGLPRCVFDTIEWQLLEWGSPKRYSAVDIRLALMDAYAAADRPTREKWARETRELAGWVACDTCWGSTEEGSGHVYANCPACHGYGIVPPAQEEVTA